MISSTLLFIAVLGFLVTIHELGHLVIAKLFKIRVNEFALGFGKTVFKTNRGGMLWSVRSLPLGGYVAFDEGQGNTLENAPLYQRILVCLAGPLANLLAAMLITFSSLMINGYSESSNKIKISHVKSLKKDDAITHVDGAPTSSWQEIKTQLINKKQATLTINSKDKVTVNYQEEEKPGFVKRLFSLFKKQKPALGWGIEGALGEKIYLGPVKALFKSFETVKGYVLEFFVTIRAIATSGLGVLFGPVGIAKKLSAEAGKGSEELMQLIAKLSVSLAMFNLLPVPGLDGGQVVLNVIKRFVPSWFVSAWYYGAFGLLIVLTTYITLNDLIRL